jgi:hypothetical protein
LAWLRCNNSLDSSNYSEYNVRMSRRISTGELTGAGNMPGTQMETIAQTERPKSEIQVNQEQT